MTLLSAIRGKSKILSDLAKAKLKYKALKIEDSIGGNVREELSIAEDKYSNLKYKAIKMFETIIENIDTIYYELDKDVTEINKYFQIESFFPDIFKMLYDEKV